MADFGAGIYLDQNFDFEVDESGDIRTISGEPELQKDAAFFLSDELQDELGSRRDNATLKRIEIVAEDVALEDPRIDEIVSTDVRRVGTNMNRVEVIMEVNTDTGPQELVFEVTL